MAESVAYSMKDAVSARKACKHWRIAILVGLVFPAFAVIWEYLTCKELRNARNTLRTPILVTLLFLIWPLMTAVDFVVDIMPLQFPILVAILLAVTQIVGTFFVRQAIFLQWATHFEDPELDRMISWWERFTIYSHFPLAAIAVWIGIIALTHGWNTTNFQLPDMSNTDTYILLAWFLATLFALIFSVVYQYKTVKRFETRHWARIPMKRLRQEKEKLEEFRARNRVP